MPLISNGQLLIRAPSGPAAAEAAEAALEDPLQLTTYSLETLFEVPTAPATEAAAALEAAPEPAWSLAKPIAVLQQNPWDAAHQAAAQRGYDVYVEPDILHAFAPTPPPEAALEAVAPPDLIRDYPPSGPV